MDRKAIRGQLDLNFSTEFLKHAYFTGNYSWHSVRDLSVTDLSQNVQQLNLALEGSENTPLANTIAQINAILTNLNNLTADPAGLVPKLLEDQDAQGSIASILNQLDSTMSDVNAITTSVEGDMPAIALLLSQVQSLLKQTQDVMEGLKNNPLLKNGISQKPEKENAAPKLREDNF